MLRELKPTDKVCGFDIRPGHHLINGATLVRGGVNFTISSVNATSCTLLLFRPREHKPYAKIPFPESYRIGDTYSMMVYGLNQKILNTHFNLMVHMILQEDFFLTRSM